MNLLSITLIAGGGILIYSAIKGKDPRDVVKSGLSGKSPETAPVAYELYPTTDPTQRTGV